ncbi:MAG: Zn-ribbon domain-containing OB-fold protein [Gammaproteobacteria bacterium]
MANQLDKDGNPLAAERPLPDIDRPLSAPFWQAARRHELMIQRCQDCGHWIWYPQDLCYQCNSAKLGWEKIGGNGTIYTYIVVRHGLHPYFAKHLPLAVAMVSLDDAPYVRLLANIMECKPEDVKVGMPVEVVFEDVDERVTLPQFRPRR